MSSYPIPDAWSARDHETIPLRTRKGRSTFERKRAHVAPIIGEMDRPTDTPMSDDALSDDASNARIVAGVLLRGTRRMNAGLSGLDVERVADLVYGRLGLDPVIGTQVTSWEQTIHRDITDSSPVTARRSFLSGPYRDATWDALACPAAEYRANTRRTVSLARRPLRVTLPIGRPRTGDAVDSRVFVAHPAGDVVPAWSLIAPAIDTAHRWHGHQLVTRPVPTTIKRADARKANQARTVGEIDEPDDWSTVGERINRGERIVVRNAGGERVTITRGAKFNASGTWNGERVRWSGRSTAKLAAILT